MPLLSLNEVSRKLNLHQRTVQAMVLMGDVPFTKVGNAWAFDDKGLCRLEKIKADNARKRDAFTGANAS